MCGRPWRLLNLASQLVMLSGCIGFPSSCANKNTPCIQSVSISDTQVRKELGKVREELGKSKADKPPRAARFTPPTLAEVQTYVAERHSPVDPQGFIDFYEAKGWMVGKSLMKDWKAACRNAEHWERWTRGKRQADKPFVYNYGSTEGSL